MRILKIDFKAFNSSQIKFELAIFFKKFHDCFSTAFDFTSPVLRLTLIALIRKLGMCWTKWFLT